MRIRLSLTFLLILAGCKGEGDSEIITPTISSLSSEGQSVTSFNLDSSNRAGWWSPITSYNENLYIAYNASGEQSKKCSDNSTHYLALASKDKSGNWNYILANSTEGYWYSCDDIGHKQPTIAMDGDGTIHVWAGMHNEGNGCCYFLGDSGLNSLEQSFMFQNKGSFTYPIAKSTPEGDIYLIIRNLPKIKQQSEYEKYSGSGDLYHWNNTSKTWRLIAKFAANTKEENGLNAPVYPNDLFVDTNGNVHILWEWSSFSPSARRYQGSYAVYNPNENSFITSAGNLLTPPVSLSTLEIYPEISYENSNPKQDKGTYIQTSKLVFDNTYCSPCIIYRKFSSKDEKILMTRWSEGQWSDAETIYSDISGSFATLDAVIDESKISVFYAKKGEGVIVSERDFSDNTWGRNLFLASNALDIRLAAHQTADNTYLYISEIQSNSKATLSILPLARELE
ncbi:hypothetical protein AT00_21295 [Pseudoalteromonas lipolytica SCSIO 04301]|uniref:BNR repeat-containing family member n=1 Tax=Pseudoalteromonas lipolytica TaxID=570156 RepID=A0ABY1GV78_9GAMM|nr:MULTISPECIES: BNR-4 repeat-containing protein [Pseudoalteromonas]EWH04146.1 hypothetical protein AT00_21295 [Pseudoalteromonas lipolytica SCSIO 04301]MBE0352476.1 hypothetical protein [Pseudoalteromonas lipolytica LMEB 39]QPL42968.1 BNR-4 repeat-containing protein [Pseudoalteromonas sp. A41-2]SFT93147.1 BNR repeat-containing family member [Pseudoalteromonas lipolytica]